MANRRQLPFSKRARILPSAEGAEYWAAIATLIGIPVGVLSLGYAIKQFWLAQKSGSGTLVVALSENFRACWADFLKAGTDAERQYAFGDLANMLEIACATYHDNVLFGETKELLKQYLFDVFSLIEASPDASVRLTSLLQYKSTFSNVQRFLEIRKNALRGKRPHSGEDNGSSRASAGNSGSLTI